MKILGLGSNIGNRKQYMRDTIRCLHAAGNVMVRKVSPLYQSDAMLLPGSSSEWQIPFLNCAVSIDTTCEPEQLLAQIKAIEKKIGRCKRERWAPREIDIDILLWDTLQMNHDRLAIPHSGLLERPFALLPLADLAADMDFPGREQEGFWRSLPAAEVPFKTCRTGSLFPDWVAVVNLTPDSFSDGAQLQNVDAALEYCSKAIEAGASVIDVGAESTRPGSKELSSQEEWSRLECFLPEIIKHVKQVERDVLISVDTRNAATAEKAVSLGVDWINDVCGFSSEDMLSLAAAAETDLVVMHSLSIPPSAGKILHQGTDPLQQLLEWAENKIEHLESRGIDRQRIIIDPGIGFGKSPEQNLAILKNAFRLHQLSVRILIGHSRKSFLKLFTDAEAAERDPETAAISSCLAGQGIDYLRVHNVALNSKVTSLQAALDGVARWS